MLLVPFYKILQGENYIIYRLDTIGHGFILLRLKG